VLTPQAVEKLFVTLRRLAAKGCAILYISHKLDEIRALCHHCTVLRGGKVTGEVDPTQQSNASLSRLMIGAEPPQLQQRAHRAGEVVLRVDGLSLPRQDAFGIDLHDIGFEVRAGEIVGVAGVEGNGQAELIEALAGLRPAAGGEVRLGGRDVTRLAPRGRFRAGLAHVPADRLARGLVGPYSLADNLILGSQREPPFARRGWLARTAIREHAARTLAAYDVRPPAPAAAARTLSGGNQQKLVVARELSRGARVVLAAHPTRGVDLGAIEFIHRRLVAERDAGRGVLLVSSDLGELLSLADRLIVLYEGRVVFEAAPADTDERTLGLYMSGHGAGATSPGAPRS
jgi:simple sugar transport system ATP-binding protein